MNRRLLAVVAAIIMVVAVGAAIFMQFSKPPAPGKSLHDGRSMSLRQEKTADGNWTINIINSLWTFDELRLTVINASTGSATLDVKLSDIAPGKNHPDAAINDSNGDKKLGPGDSIILKGTSPNIKAGYKVQFQVKGAIAGTISELQ